MKPYLGDALSLANSVPMMKVLVRYGEREVCFSAVVTKLNKRNKMQERILVVTESALYNIDKNLGVKRRIPLSTIGGVSLSIFEDNFIIVHVPMEYDYLLITERKTELVTTLLQLYHRSTGQILPFTFSDKLELKGKEEDLREVVFKRVDGGVDMVINNVKTRTIRASLIKTKSSLAL